MSQHIRRNFIAFLHKGLVTSIIRGKRLSMGVVLMSALAVGMAVPAAKVNADMESDLGAIFGKGKASPWFWIVSAEKGLCLGTIGGKKGIFLQGCNKGNHHQQWQRLKRGSSVAFRGRARSKCMDVDGTLSTWKNDKRPIEVEPCKSSLDMTSRDQFFNAFPTKPGRHSQKNATYFLRIKHSGKCAGLTYYSAYRLDQRNCSQDAWQKFFFTPVGEFKRK